MTNTDKLTALNAVRAKDGLAPLADWRNARHQPMLDEYLAKERSAAAYAEAVAYAEAAAAIIMKAKKAKKEKGPKDPTPAYKRMAHYVKSAIENPVQFVHSFLDANPGMKRKAAVAALVEQGVNFSTARTQYQRWFTARKAK